MTSGDILAGFAALVAAVIGFERLLRLFIGNRCVRLEELRQLEKAMTTGMVFSGAEVTRAHHRIDLLLEVLKSLPGYAQMQAVREEIDEIVASDEVEEAYD